MFFTQTVENIAEKKGDIFLGKIHLICNAHLDPVWMWQWKEGVAEAISTFRVAADFCEQYDGFVFNHNEALLYEWVEEYAPKLFERIQKLVAQGKWKILGGWYLQPDCLMLSGESFLTQIELGRNYFREKFGVVPETAMNVDPFGHSRGLVQILQKTGFKNYLFMRPEAYHDDFIWEGFSDTQVIAHGIYGCYNALKGDAVNKLKRFLKDRGDRKTGLLLWGVGNHGGGVSRVDLEGLNNQIHTYRETEGMEILHSNAEDYFSELQIKNLPRVSESLVHVMVGSYTSMVRIKQKHREFENKLSVAQKMATLAKLSTNASYPEAEIYDIKKTLAFCQFHDILPGTVVKSVEEDSLRTMSYGLEKCDKLIAKAFFALSQGQKPANDGEIPILIYNPHPYPVKGTFEVEFILPNQNWAENEITLAEVYDTTGNRLLCQNEKPQATFVVDWVEKVVFSAELQPTCMNRFDCKLHPVQKEPWQDPLDDKIVVTGANSQCIIDRNTGLISEYSVAGVSKIQNSGVLELYRDTEDPWGMTVNGFYDKIGDFRLLDEQETALFLGYSEASTPNVVISEDGEVRTKIDAFFRCEDTFAVVEYIMDKITADLDIRITLYANNANRCIKYRIDSSVEDGEFFGQTAFGAEKLDSDGREVTYQKWCGICGKENALYVLNKGMYAGSFCDKSLFLTLLRTPVYSAHPIEGRTFDTKHRFSNRIDMGERSFHIRLSASSDYEKKALLFNEEPVAISYFAKEEPREIPPVITLDNEAVQISLMKIKGDKLKLHLFNTSPDIEAVTVSGCASTWGEVTLKGFEVKFYEVENNHLVETDVM